MRPAATEGVEWPSPSPLAFHSSFGPPGGQLFSNPVSFETPLRSGPCHCGQSPPPAGAANAASTVRLTPASMMATPEIVLEDILFFSFSGKVMEMRQTSNVIRRRPHDA